MKRAFTADPARQPPRVGAIVLAAGRSRRMQGGNKLLADIGGRPLVLRAVHAACAADCAQVVVVTGHDRAAVEAALAGLPVTFVRNEDYAEGMASSLRRGLDAIAPEIDAALIVLADMPAIAATDINRLIAAFDPATATIVVPARDGRRGNPVLWPRRYFDEMRRLAGDTGARALIERHHQHVTVVAMTTDAIFADVDTPDALRAFVSDSGQR